jgi:alpha-1,2-mannosyltransferase
VGHVVSALAQSWRRVLLAVAAAWTLLVLGWIEIAGIVSNQGIGTDFLAGIYYPARAVAHGVVPYGDPRVAGPLAESVYPPSAFVPFAWLGLLGHDAAVAVWLLLMAAAACATLWLLGVRDPRCYALWLLTPMMLSTVAVGNATTLVILFVAVLWRWRDSPLVAACALVAAIATKLFAAPLIVWLIATRRYRAAALTAAGVPLVILSCWAVVGFAAIERYSSILAANNHIFSPSGPYVQGFVLQLHGSPQIAIAGGVTVAVILLAAAWFAGDFGGFVLASCAAVILSPVAWIGYMGLLVIPLATRWPRWSRAWLVLLGTFISWYYSPIDYASPQLSVCTLALGGLIVATVLRGRNQAIAPSAASTSSACVAGFTSRIAFSTVPSGPMTKVERTMPM